MNDELLEKIIENFKEVYDPEIPINIYDLGLIYDVAIDENNNVDIKMTLTTPNCPAAEFLPGEVENSARLEEVNNVNLELVWDPPWDPNMISDDGQLALGLI